MFFPIRTDVPLRSTPWMNWLILIVNCLIFFLQHGIINTDPWALDPRHLHLINYVSYQFVHADAMHLIGNMLFLYIFGNNLNDRMGHLGYLGFYLAGGVTAGMTHVLTQGSAVIGASGSIAAVTGAFLILFPRARVTIVYFFFLIGMFELASLWFILANFVLNLISEARESMTGQGGVAYTAHIGGYIFGAAVCFLLLACKLLPRNQWDLLALIDRWNRRRQYRDMVASGYDPFGGRPRKLAAPDPRTDRLMELRAEIAEAISHSRLDDAMKLFMQLRAMDPAQVLSRQNQLDMGNYLYEHDQHAAAADAYEGFVRTYPKADQANHITLMLGLLYSRYLNRPDKAEPYLRQAVEKLHEGREQDLAREELAKITATR